MSSVVCAADILVTVKKADTSRLETRWGSTRRYPWIPKARVNQNETRLRKSGRSVQICTWRKAKRTVAVEFGAKKEEGRAYESLNNTGWNVKGP